MKSHLFSDSSCNASAKCQQSSIFDIIYGELAHDLLLAKLSHYGIRDVANDWLTSYLHNCYQSEVIME